MQYGQYVLLQVQGHSRTSVTVIAEAAEEEQHGVNRV
jgi:hypothetical protein